MINNIVWGVTQTNGPRMVMILITTIYGKAPSPEKTKYNSSYYHDNAYSVDIQSQQSDLWDTWENQKLTLGPNKSAQNGSGLILHTVLTIRVNSQTCGTIGRTQKLTSVPNKSTQNVS